MLPITEKAKYCLSRVCFITCLVRVEIMIVRLSAAARLHRAPANYTGSGDHSKVIVRNQQDVICRKRAADKSPVKHENPCDLQQQTVM